MFSLDLKIKISKYFERISNTKPFNLKNIQSDLSQIIYEEMLLDQ